jgi:prevent-host-death family protein
LCVVQSVGIREIRQNLSVFLRRVRAGESFTVTEHGHPVALLTPVPASADDPLADLVAVGRVLPAGDADAPLPQPAPARGGRSATQALLAERDADAR